MSNLNLRTFNTRSKGTANCQSAPQVIFFLRRNLIKLTATILNSQWTFLWGKEKSALSLVWRAHKILLGKKSTFGLVNLKKKWDLHIWLSPVLSYFCQFSTILVDLLTLITDSDFFRWTIKFICRLNFYRPYKALWKQVIFLQNFEIGVQRINITVH